MNKKFILPVLLYSLSLLTLGILLIFHNKGEMELNINEHHTSQLGYFFKYITHLGDGFMYLILGIFFLLFNYSNAILLVLISIFQTIIVQVLKKIIFFDALRPTAFFAEHPQITLKLTEGVEVHSVHSFPSGHTATAFAIAVLLTYLVKNNWLSVLFFITACLVGLSRVYLLQHFFEDIFVGAVIGIMSSFMMIYLFNKFFSKVKSNSKMNRGLIK